MSGSTVYTIVSVTSGMFRWAVKLRLANANPVTKARELYGAEMPSSATRE
jgi:hypothetical protein